jgi:spermidine synthase
VGLIGLGAGTLAWYGRAGDLFRFYEINPLVIEVAQRDFGYLRRSKARVEIVEGDARLQLAAEPAHAFDVLIVDAFSGDAIPVHLLTREALAIYLDRLKPGGTIAMHISNQYLNLEPVVRALARDAGCGSVRIASEADGRRAQLGAVWMIVRRGGTDGGGAGMVWTDDWNSVLPVLK